MDFKDSAQDMEPEDAVWMFKCSKELQKFRYSELFGDGDSKTHEQDKELA